MKNTIVNTDKGPVRGEYRDPVLICRGIPYGAPVDGEKRFLPPEEAAPWDEVMDCTENGPICMQLSGSVQTWPDQGPAFHGGHPEKFKVDHETKSESCLNLNVMTPAADGEKRPVLFYIHGGGYACGSGALIFGADRFCAEENVVLVSVNHRLGPFGYLYLGAFDEKYRYSGIVGLLDLVLALKWVQRNISAFGGDPEQVTILGESGGGSKVSALLSMDCTEGLFQAAVIESGAAPEMFHSKESGAQIAERALAHIGVKAGDLSRLSALSENTVLAMTEPFRLFEKSFVPTPDGQIMPFWNGTDSKLAKWAAEVRIMIGSSVGEGALFEHPDCYPKTEEELRRRLLEEPDPDAIVPISHALCTPDTVGQMLSDLRSEAGPEETYAQLYYRALSKVQFNDPALKLAEDYLDQGADHILQYLVVRPTRHPEFPEFRFAWHTATLPLQLGIVLHEEDGAFAGSLSHQLACFMRDDPMYTSEGRWESYSKQNPFIWKIT